MKKGLILLIALTVVSIIYVQDVSDNKKTGNDYKPSSIKVGYNISYENGSNSGFAPKNNNGFMVTGFFGSAGKSIIGYRSEIVFPHQGYTYDDAGKNTDVKSDYIYLPQLTIINITKCLQL